MKLNKKVYKNSAIMLLSLVIGFMCISPTYAMENKVPPKDEPVLEINPLNEFDEEAITPRSGGVVSVDYTIQYIGSPTQISEEYPLSNKHEHDSSISPESTVDATFVVERTSTITGNISTETIDQLRFEVGYGASVTSGNTSSHTYTVTENGYYQIFFKVTYKKQNFKQVATVTYYDTSIGYYTESYTVDSSYKIPVSSYVYLKRTSS